jgi:hypothetical protein
MHYSSLVRGAGNRLLPAEHTANLSVADACSTQQRSVCVDLSLCANILWKL